MRTFLSSVSASALAMSLLACGPAPESQWSSETQAAKSSQSPIVESLFHPFDPTLDKVATWLKEAESTADIAMYNMDTSLASPVIAYLASPEFKAKVSQGFKVRFIFEGYNGVDDATKRSRELESYGIDVRWVTSARKVHHKFAALDVAGAHPRVISGSANWSLSSRKNYNENMLFVSDSPSFASLYEAEFNKLWAASSEFENALGYPDVAVGATNVDNGLSAYFNSANFTFNGTRIAIDRRAPGYALTRTLEAAILNAKKTIRIATTRVQLRPLYDALAKVTVPRVAQDGSTLPPVDVELVVNMDQYDYKSRRDRMSLGTCADPYAKECSTSKTFAWFLAKDDFPGKDHIKVRVKYYNLRPDAYLTKQMHSKYMVVDDETIYTGSFNWSYGGEYENFENLMRIDGQRFPAVLKSYVADHARVFGQGRDEYQAYVGRLETALRTGVKTDCSFEPMALTYAEIDYMLDTATRLGKPRLQDACR